MKEALRCAETANGGAPCPAIPGSVAREADGVPRCLSHALDPVRVRRREERNAAGGRGRLRTLPPDTPRPDFSTPQRTVRFAENTARLVLIGDLDPKLSAEARGWVTAVAAIRAAEAQERIAAALDKVEHGGAAVVLLERLRAGIAEGPRRPLPGARPPRQLEGHGA